MSTIPLTKPPGWFDRMYGQGATMPSGSPPWFSWLIFVLALLYAVALGIGGGLVIRAHGWH